MSGAPQGEALLKALSSVALEVQREKTVGGLIRAAGDGLRKHGLSFAVLQRDGDVIRIVHANIPPEVRAASPRSFEGMVVPMSQLERVIAAGVGALLIGDVRRETEKFYEKYRPEKVAEVPKHIDAASFQQVAMQPLLVDGEIWGGFTLGSPTLSQADVPAVTLFGVQLNGVLERVTHHERAEQRRRELDAVNSIARMRLDRPADTLALLELIAGATGSDASALYLYDAKTDEYVMLDGAYGAGAIQEQFRRVKPILATAAMHVSDLGEARASAEAQGFRWFANVPLSADGRAIAFLTMARRKDSGYTKEELSTAELLGVQVSSLIERSRLYNQLSQRVRQLTLLFDLARAGTSAREVAPLIDKLLTLLLEHLPCDAASILYARGDELTLGGWKPRPGSGLPEKIALSNVPLDDDSITGRTLRYLKAMKVSLADAPPRTRLEMEVFGAKHMMAAPLVVGERHFGALLVGRLGDSSFTEDDLKLMDSCAAQVSVLVEHVKLFDDLRQSYSSLEKAQAEVVRHERLAALGELAAVMAHEVRNPLGVIFNSLTSLRKRTTSDSETALLLGIVGEEADRLNRIVGDLLDFARPYEAERAPIELEPIIASAVEAASSATNAQVKVVTEFAQELPRFVVDGHLVRQAVVNLVVNAIQAMPKGGTVTVRVSAEKKNGSSLARIEVADEGVGISPATEKHIFQPFFTTKATGTGLGLAVVKRIVDAHHGEISVRSGAGVGTTFTVTLPSS